MNNPTDTNQASEDGIQHRLKTAYESARAATETEEGRKAIDFFYHVHLNSWPGFANDFIRTEKLKLLAEVRERVVGEDKPLQGKYRASGLMSYDMTNHYENSLRAEQRAVLTQLEAELPNKVKEVK